MSAGPVDGAVGPLSHPCSRHCSQLQCPHQISLREGFTVCPGSHAVQVMPPELLSLIPIEGSVGCARTSLIPWAARAIAAFPFQSAFSPSASLW